MRQLLIKTHPVEFIPPQPSWVVRCGCFQATAEQIARVIALVESHRIGQVNLNGGNALRVTQKSVFFNAERGWLKSDKFSFGIIKEIAAELRSRGLISVPKAKTKKRK